MALNAGTLSRIDHCRRSVGSELPVEEPGVKLLQLGGVFAADFKMHDGLAHGKVPLLECGGSTPLWMFGSLDQTRRREEAQAASSRRAQRTQRTSSLPAIVASAVCGGSTPLWMLGSVSDIHASNTQSGVEPPHSKKEPPNLLVNRGLTTQQEEK